MFKAEKSLAIQVNDSLSYHKKDSEPDPIFYPFLNIVFRYTNFP